MTILSKFVFVLFCVVFKQFYFLNPFLSRKPQDSAENLHFLFVYFLCVGISILNIVLSDAHKWMTSDVILAKLFFFSCHELSWTFRHGEWVNITPKCIAA